MNLHIAKVEIQEVIGERGMIWGRVIARGSKGQVSEIGVEKWTLKNRRLGISLEDNLYLHSKNRNFKKM